MSQGQEHVAGQPAAPHMAERRMEERRQARSIGKVVWNKGGRVVDCVVRNISDSGAQIGVLNALAIPEIFVLRWNCNARRCMVAWRKSDRMGVKFAP